ncbi:MAG: glycosyltransferase [Bacteroidota bacterium]|nr:glycosyltransferase [Bacteroidota bacterium]
MLSIIICSRNKSLGEAFTENIKNTVGVDYEIIAVDNSENQYSIFSAYNIGFAQSNYPYVCFVHEDVLFHSFNWGERVIAHLQNPSIGIVGVAGGDLVTRVPASWANLISRGQNVILSDSVSKKPTKHLLEPENYNQQERSSITIDGLFMCMRQELMRKIHFDEDLKGFHGYDYDISIQSIVAGYTNCVIYDISLEHFSKGKTDIVYFRNLISIYKKWESYLPLIGKNITKNECLKIPTIEEKKIYQLTKKMVRKGFEVTEITSEINYYANIIGSKRAVLFLKFRIFLIRLFNCPKYIFSK